MTRQTVAKTGKRSLQLLLPVICVISCSTVVPEPVARSESVKDIINAVWAGADQVVYREPPPQELESFKTIISGILGDPQTVDKKAFLALQQQASQLGMALHPLVQAGRRYLALHEQKDHQQGRGIYFFAAEPLGDRPVLLETPHAKSDGGTQIIGQAAFTHGKIAALFLSSIRRTCGPHHTEDDSDEEHFDNCDMAHNTGTYFHTATQAFFHTRPAAMAVQFHGFKPLAKVRGSDDIMLIISRGKIGSYTDFPLNLFTAGFGQLYNGRALIYGHDVHVLGATTNVQGQFINGLETGHFVHIEMSRLLRSTLTKSKEAMEKFTDVFSQIACSYEQGDKKL